MAINFKLPPDYLREIAGRAKARRLVLNFSQAALARRSGVSLGSLKRFERTGQISLAALLKLALVLDGLEAFDALFPAQPTVIKSLSELMHDEKKRQRGRKK